jgi:hypothetical protein
MSKARADYRQFQIRSLHKNSSFAGPQYVTGRTDNWSTDKSECGKTTKSARFLNEEMRREDGRIKSQGLDT